MYEKEINDRKSGPTKSEGKKKIALKFVDEVKWKKLHESNYWTTTTRLAGLIRDGWGQDPLYHTPSDATTTHT